MTQIDALIKSIDNLIESSTRTNFYVSMNLINRYLDMDKFLVKCKEKLDTDTLEKLIAISDECIAEARG